MQLHKIAIKRQIVENFYAPPPPPPPHAKPSRRLPPGSPHRAFGPGPVQWNFIEPPHCPHSRSSCSRFCTIFERPVPVNLVKLFDRETARERLFRVIGWRCGWWNAGRGAPPARGRYGRKGNGLDVTQPVKRPNYAPWLQHQSTNMQSKLPNAQLDQQSTFMSKPTIYNSHQLCVMSF